MFGYASTFWSRWVVRGAGAAGAERPPLIERLEARQLMSGGVPTSHAHPRHVRAHLSHLAGSAPPIVQAPPVVRSPNPRLIVGTGTVLHAMARQEFTCVVASFDPLRELSPQVMQQQASSFQVNVTITWADGASDQGTLQWNAQTRRWDVCGTHTYWAAGALNFTVTVTLSPLTPVGQPAPLFGTRVIAFAESTAVTVDPPPPLPPPREDSAAR